MTRQLIAEVLLSVSGALMVVALLIENMMHSDLKKAREARQRAAHRQHGLSWSYDGVIWHK